MSTKKDIDRLLESFINERGIPGCSLHVIQNGKVLYEGYHGITDIHTKKPVDKNTLFRQASMSKLPLYTAMMMLYERGYYTLREQLDAVSKAPLKCNPGEEWIYGFSSEIAAGLVEVLCDKPINEALKELIYDPLGMDNTGAVFFSDTKDRLVTLYSKKENGEYAPGPDGFRDVYNGGYGYGYGVRTIISNEKGSNNGSVGAFGWTGAFGSWCEADPSEGISIVYMHNLMPDDEEFIHPRVRQVSYGLV